MIVDDMVSALSAKNNFGQLLDAAQRRPVTVTKKGRPVVVVESLERHEQRRKRAEKRLLALMDRSQIKAEKAGLTEEKLQSLLEDSV